MTGRRAVLLAAADHLGWLLVAVPALGIPVVFDPGGSDGYIVPRASLLVGAAALALALRCWRRTDGLDEIGLPALAVAIAAGLACAFSVSVPLSLVGSYGRYDDVVIRLSYLGVFAAATWFLRSPWQRRHVVSLFLLGCGVVAGEAVWQFTRLHVSRPDANVGQPNMLGVLLAMAVLITAHRARRDWRWLAPVPLLVAGLLVSSSRSAWLACIAGFGALIFFGVPPRRRPLAAAIAVAMTVGAIALVLGSPLRHLDSDTGAARLHVWSDSVALIASRPLTGWGEDTFGLVFGRFQSGDWEAGQVFDRAHSEPLDLLASQGVAGLLAAAWFWATWWRRLGRRLQVEEVAALGAAWIAYATWALLNFDWAPATGPAWLLAGVAWSAAREPSPERQPPVRAPAWAAAVVTAVCGAVIVAGAVLVPVADRADFNGDDVTATRLDPLQAYYHEQAGIAAIDAGQLQAAEAELKRAAGLGEDDAGSYVELGNVELALGEDASARTAYETALRIDPYYGEARQALTRVS